MSCTLGTGSSRPRQSPVVAPEDELAVQRDLPVLQRMNVCLSPVLPWPLSVDVVHAAAAQCGVLPVKRRARIRSPRAVALS